MSASISALVTVISTSTETPKPSINNGSDIWGLLVRLRDGILDFIEDVFVFASQPFSASTEGVPLLDTLTDILNGLGINNLIDLLFGLIPLVILISIIKWGIGIFTGG